MFVNHQHLHAFHAVATEGSFSQAARRLNISQPTLSQQIKALESRHGRVLFEGRRPPLRLTPVGRELLALTQHMFATSGQIADLLGDQPAGEAVAIRLASDSPVYAAHLARALLQADDSRSIEVIINNSRDTLGSLLEARADVAIASDPLIDPRLAYKPLFVDSLKMVLPVDHPLASAPDYPLAMLANERLLLREPTSKTRSATDSLLAAHDILPLRRIELHSREAIREAVAIGMGVSLFFSAECPPDARLAYRDAACHNPACQHDPALHAGHIAGLITGYVVCAAERRRTAFMRSVLESAAMLEPLSPIPLDILNDSSASRHKAATSLSHEADITI